MDFTLKRAAKDCDFEDMTDNDLIRLCVGAVVYMENIKAPAEAAALMRELRDEGGPSFCRWSDALEFGLDGQDYRLMTYEDAREAAEASIEDFADEQETEMDRTLAVNGINSNYVCFNREMFVQDAGYEWEQFLNSYDGVIEEYFPLTPGADNTLITQNSYAIWRS